MRPYPSNLSHYLIIPHINPLWSCLDHTPLSRPFTSFCLNCSSDIPSPSSFPTIQTFLSLSGPSSKVNKVSTPKTCGLLLFQIQRCKLPSRSVSSPGTSIAFLLLYPSKPKDIVPVLLTKIGLRFNWHQDPTETLLCTDALKHLVRQELLLAPFCRKENRGPGDWLLLYDKKSNQSRTIILNPVCFYPNSMLFSTT